MSNKREDSFFDLFRRLDRFAEPVTVNYRGRGMYNSLGGGCLSLLIALVVIGFGVVKVEQLVTRKAPTIVSGLEQYHYESGNEDINQKLELEDQGVDVVIRVDDDLDLAERARYGKIVAFMIQHNLASGSEYGAQAGAESVAEWFLDANADLEKLKSGGTPITLGDCKEPQHLAHLDSTEKALVITQGNK